MRTKYALLGLMFFAALCVSQVFSASGGRPLFKKGQEIPVRVTLEGGKRACVIFAGDHEPVQDLELQIQDADGRVVAEAGGPNQGDALCVILYPERTGQYTVTFKNDVVDLNRCTIAVK